MNLKKCLTGCLSCRLAKSTRKMFCKFSSADTKELIYTFIGNILVALNPYRSLDIYGINEVKKYENQVLGCLPPHLFAIGSSAFSKLIKDNESQLFIVR